MVSSGLFKLISFFAQSMNRWLIRKLFVGMAKCWSIWWRVEPSAIGLAYGGSEPTWLGNTWTGGGTIAVIGIGFPLMNPFFNSSFNHFFSCQCSSSLCSNNLYFESSNSLSLCKTRCPSSIGPPSTFCLTFLLSFHLISIAYWWGKWFGSSTTGWYGLDVGVSIFGAEAEDQMVDDEQILVYVCFQLKYFFVVFVGLGLFLFEIWFFNNCLCLCLLIRWWYGWWWFKKSGELMISIWSAGMNLTKNWIN